MEYMEQGWHNTTIKRPGCEIHHSRDDYADYAHMIQHLRQPVGLHHHDFYEIFLFISGEMEYHVENRMYHMLPGDLLLISPMELHQPVFVPAQGFYERIVLWVEPAMLQALCEENEDLSACFNKVGGIQTNLIRTAQENICILTQLMQQLVRVTHGQTGYAKVQEKALLCLILAKINEWSAQQKTGEAPKNKATKHTLSKHTTTAVEYIAFHLGEELRLETLAQVCFVSPQHLLRVFKADMGVSVHQYITQKRLLTARQYLQSGMPPMAAAQRCGFANYPTFWRSYKKEYGVSPSNFKQ